MYGFISERFLCLDNLHSLNIPVRVVDLMGNSAFGDSSMLQGPNNKFITIKVMDNLNKLCLMDYLRNQDLS
jgi:hypothetical protein